ncbi:Serum amyloid A protein [Magnetococcus marinus MC-1]|uniref:Serum amyloid A protein n=1 Tax=Magnetococcus marinus (strain ATCC BAA-1437 / JCM 17883 / MC-1) TaxID=156889 RepID=A0L550_MAGMM|nr:serum amyloid A protein [Magnetococcus marinus]ABK43093.1 Serum amyloid A protein [Magnetococcus marinus MC-1]
MGRNWYPGAPWRLQSAYVAEATDRVGQAFNQVGQAVKHMGQAALGAADMAHEYGKMRHDNVQLSDKYHHCMANCRATSRGPGGHQAAETISHVRELYGTHVKGDPLWDRRADEAANQHGRSGAGQGQSCKQVCSPYRVRGINPKY